MKSEEEPSEASRWLKQAEQDLESARKNLNIQEYRLVAFLCQQSVEKALKAAYIKRFKELLKTHDIVLIARKINAEEDILDKCKKLNPAYVDTRYPDIEAEYTEEKAVDLIKIAEEVLAWTKKAL